MFTTWNLLKKVGSGFQSVESSFDMASNSDAVDDETLCLEEGEYMLIAMISGDEGLYRITSNGMLIDKDKTRELHFLFHLFPESRVNQQRRHRRSLILVAPLSWPHHLQVMIVWKNWSGSQSKMLLLRTLSQLM